MTAPTSGNEIRRAYVDFFGERDHTVVPSASLIPSDPTVLLTIAGMVPFKPYLLGEEKPPFPRAVSVQKVIRTVDIEIVGTTARHFSFFEMLGNFSFGDYFKERAIPLAYEFVTETLQMDPDRLWFTVHDDDDDAEEIWIETVGVPADRVQRRPDSENFWQMGVAGPAGPSSEIFYDRGPEYGPDGGPVVDEERFMEFWNLVFMQYVQDEPYHVVGDLPARSIDTGSSLERVATLLQGAETAYVCDLVRPVLAAGEAATGVAYGHDDRADISLRILADHGRAITFLIGDGVVPANEGRGYVLRRLLRRAVRHARQLGAEDDVSPGLVRATVDVMGDAYPALREAADGIVEMAQREESRFRRTLDSGTDLLEEELEELDGSVLPGDLAFKLHDTYGFPIELTEEIVAERGVTVDRDGFDSAMEEQRERARAARSTDVTDGDRVVYRELIDSHGATRFLGYDMLDTDATVLAILREGEPIESAEEGSEVEVFFDRSTFYGESGGQVGDTGQVSTETGTLAVRDTQLPLAGLHGHRATVEKGTIRVGQHASLSVAAGRRERIRKSHTGTHILHWALREVVGSHVQQAGSLVESGRLRFDFSHFSALAEEELIAVEEAANERVIENARVRAYEVSRKEADELGALAFFGDKYGDQVRIVEAGAYSRELCGGTHVPTTGQIGPLIVVGEASIGSNLRRIEAFTGSSAYEYLLGLRSQLKTAAEVLRVRPEQVGEAAGALVDRTRAQEERIEAFEARSRSQRAEDLANAGEQLGKGTLVVAEVDGAQPEQLRLLGMQVRDRVGTGVVVLGANWDGKASLVGLVTGDLVANGVSASDVVGPAARLVGGGGSRDPELSQAGGPQGDRIPEALAEARRLAAEALGA